MSSPLAWQGDGPPQKLALTLSAQYSVHNAFLAYNLLTYSMLTMMMHTTTWLDGKTADVHRLFHVVELHSQLCSAPPKQPVICIWITPLPQQYEHSHELHVGIHPRRILINLLHSVVLS